ncbi:NAD(P)-dependent oxidoreductase [Nocardia sp. NPDC052566]|uniref:NAD(P)-dependent oxidoreductase n=1 Tax=Nocardia sp. NPDC052566 TaxID=3364330 RepID=UPI0037C53DC1
MDIGIFGATGVIGSRVLTEARERGHRVTAFTRDAARIPAEHGGADWRVANWLDIDSVAAAIDGLDVVISAINAGHGVDGTIAEADNFVIAARAMIGALHRHPSVRLINLGGAGSLEIAPGLLLVDGPDFDRGLVENLRVPVEYRKAVQAGVDALNLYRLSNRNWTYVSPSSGRINPGERTGRFRIGGDQLLLGGGDISAEDVAVALIDEAELPRFVQRRFTVGY